MGSSILLSLAALALAAIILILLAGKLSRTAKPAKNRERGMKAESTGPRPRSCPICDSLLGSSERVKSDITPGTGDRLMRIYGCPRCWPAVTGGKPRFCPVCRVELGPKDHLIARYFEKPGRRHVHVLGCTSCRKKQGVLQ